MVQKWVRPTKNGVKVQTFNIEGEETDEQVIICKVRICAESCGNPERNDQCPKTENFSYTVSGYIE